MRKLSMPMVVLAVTVSSCVPLASPNPLAQSLTPTARIETEVPSATPTVRIETPRPTPKATTQVASKEELIAPTPSGESFQPQLEQVSIDLNEVVTLLPRDAIPAILPDKVPQIMVSAADADAAGIEDEVQVIGVSINGESRAYPIPFLSRHEIVNDAVGGRLIAATW